MESKGYIYGSCKSKRARASVQKHTRATLSRPGPRIVDGLEYLAQIIHSELFPVEPGPARWASAVGKC